MAGQAKNDTSVTSSPVTAVATLHTGQTFELQPVLSPPQNPGQCVPPVTLYVLMDDHAHCRLLIHGTEPSGS